MYYAPKGSVRWQRDSLAGQPPTLSCEDRYGADSVRAQVLPGPVESEADLLGSVTVVTETEFKAVTGCHLNQPGSRIGLTKTLAPPGRVQVQDALTVLRCGECTFSCPPDPARAEIGSGRDEPLRQVEMSDDLGAQVEDHVADQRIVLFEERLETARCLGGSPELFR